MSTNFGNIICRNTGNNLSSINFSEPKLANLLLAINCREITVSSIDDEVVRTYVTVPFMSMLTDQCPATEYSVSVHSGTGWIGMIHYHMIGFNEY